jgi:hypothetical protein
MEDVRPRIRPCVMLLALPFTPLLMLYAAVRDWWRTR